MTEPGRSAGSNGGRRPKRFLSPSQKYELWIGLLRGEYTMAEAAERAGVDRSTIMKLRTVAKQGALDQLNPARCPQAADEIQKRRVADQRRLQPRDDPERG
jgi:hypothetical protein